jgi:hypothetical protein
METDPLHDLAYVKESHGIRRSLPKAGQFD